MLELSRQERWKNSILQGKMRLRYGKEFDVAGHQACRAKGLVTASAAEEVGQARTCEEYCACISLLFFNFIFAYISFITHHHPSLDLVVYHGFFLYFLLLVYNTLRPGCMHLLPLFISVSLA